MSSNSCLEAERTISSSSSPPFLPPDLPPTFLAASPSPEQQKTAFLSVAAFPTAGVGPLEVLLRRFPSRVLHGAVASVETPSSLSSRHRHLRASTSVSSVKLDYTFLPQNSFFYSESRSIMTLRGTSAEIAWAFDSRTLARPPLF